jgi:hypothetical protein
MAGCPLCYHRRGKQRREMNYKTLSKREESITEKL